MATDGPDQTPCSPEIYERGEVVHVSDTYGAHAFERLVQRVATETMTQTDWHYVGGRAVVRTLGDVQVVKAACERIIVPVIEAERAKAVGR